MADGLGERNEGNIPINIENISLSAPEDNEMIEEPETLIIKLEEQGSDVDSINESNGNTLETVNSTKTSKGRGHWRRGKKTKLSFRCTNYLKVLCGNVVAEISIYIDYEAAYV